MNRHLHIPHGTLIALVLFAQGTFGQPAPRQPRVSLALTYDLSIAHQSVLTIESMFREHLAHRSDFVPVLDEEPLTAHLTEKAESRRELVLRGRQRQSQYAAYIHLSKVQPSVGIPYAKAFAWVASPDSGAYVLVTEAWWAPDDTLTMRRRIRLFLDRLIPSRARRSCYVQQSDEGVQRDVSTSGVLEAVTELRVRTSSHEPGAHARVWGHWQVNAVPEVTEAVMTDERGTARVRYDASRSRRAAGDVWFVVDSAWCAGALFDQQYPQREVDRAIALLENARAELDEEKNYDEAIQEARRFAALTEEDVEWYGMLMTPFDAPDRRQQAVNILRRAQAERDYERLSHHTVPQADERVSFEAWFGYDVLPPSEGDRSADPDPVRCDTCGVLSLPSDCARRVDMGLSVRLRVISRLWTGVSGSWSYGLIRRNLREPEDFTASTSTLSASLRIPYELRSGLSFYGETGARFTERSERIARRYWAQGSAQVNPPAQGPYWIEREAPGGFHPGVECALGLSLRLHDWEPTWLHTDLRAIYDDIGDHRNSWRVQMRLGVSYGE